jgi:hypothetical protein
MMHPGLAALEKWDTIEYAAGYRARLPAIPDSEIAHHCWRCGWEDLLLIEAVLPEDLNPSWVKMLDIFMLALMAGRERTLSEFENLLTASGFRLDKVIDAGLGTSIRQASTI